VPEIYPENEDAEKIYFIVQDQYILGMGGPVAINQVAIHMAIDMYDIDDPVGTFEKVVTLCRYFISKDNEKAQAQRKSK